MSFTKVAPAGIGTSPGTSILIGDSLLHSTGIDIGSNTGVGVTIRQHGDATFTGIVTASSFSGSGANLTGIDATAIKHTDGNVKVQAINTGANLTGNLSVSGNLGVGGVLTYEDVTNIDSVGVITARSGIKIGPTAGVAGTFFADGSYVTAGIITATSFSGSGANLTSLPAANLTGTLPAISGANLTGLSGVSVANQANNRLITATGTTDALNGEANLTWNGSNLDATGSGGITLRAGSTTANGAALYLDGDSDGDWSGATFAHITHDTSGHLNIMARNPGGNSMLIFGTNDYNAFRVDENRHVRPESDNARDLGTSSYRWRNLYTTDLQLSNKGSHNDVDGTWGNYTIQEGENDLFLINNRNGKKYKFNLTEVS